MLREKLKILFNYTRYIRQDALTCYNPSPRVETKIKDLINYTRYIRQDTHTCYKSHPHSIYFLSSKHSNWKVTGPWSIPYWCPLNLLRFSVCMPIGLFIQPKRAEAKRKTKNPHQLHQVYKTRNTHVTCLIPIIYTFYLQSILIGKLEGPWLVLYRCPLNLLRFSVCMPIELFIWPERVEDIITGKLYFNLRMCWSWWVQIWENSFIYIWYSD